jgi:hypothetical protein
MSGCINPFSSHKEQALARFRITSHMKTSGINFPSLTNLATRPCSEPNGASSAQDVSTNSKLLLFAKNANVCYRQVKRLTASAFFS